MPGLQRFAALLATLATAALAASCGPKRVSSPSHPGDATTIVLLSDTETGAVGRAHVSNEAGAVDLAAERDATQVVGTQSPGPINTLSESDVERIFGDALSALPAPPRRFILHFRFDSDDLTDEARSLVPQILRSVTARSVPDVVVVGHTDTAGTSSSNFELGLKRANYVRNLLVDAGLAPSAIEIVSLGETDPLIRTPDETPEARNRRVEIAVR
jgi:outer membrane protein OmpA-like peptidoglycan-associated protein